MIDPSADFAGQLADMRRRIDELERHASRAPDLGGWHTVDVDPSNVSGWSVSVSAARVWGPMLALVLQIERTGIDVSGGGLTQVATLDVPGGSSGSRWTLDNITSTATTTFPLIVATLVPSSGNLSVRIPTGVTYANGANFAFSGIVPLAFA